MHLQALHSNGRDRKKVAQYVELVERIIENFPCPRCRKHASVYLSKHPITDPELARDKEGLFKWSWTFHNAVNARLGKEYIDYDQAKSIYEQQFGSCDSDCGSDGITEAANHDQMTTDTLSSQDSRSRPEGQSPTRANKRSGRINGPGQSVIRVPVGDSRLNASYVRYIRLQSSR